MELGGRYRLDTELGRGAMGEVWRAHDRILGREVAVKLMLSALSDTEMLERFRREAVIAASLQHPGITVVHDAGWHDGQLFMVMELLSGQDLRATLTANPSGLPVSRSMAIIGQASGALAAVHQKGIVHRDLKPENLFIQQPGDRVKIADFGIARDDDMTTLTTVGHPIGTPLYMAPERWEGEPATAASDLYALGCVLYEMLTGEPPFNGTLVAVVNQHLKVVPPSPRERRDEVPKRLNDLVMSLIAKDPARRPPSAAAVSSALRGMLRELLSYPARSTDPPAPPLGVKVTAPVGCLWSARGGFETFFLNDSNLLVHARLAVNGDWDGWHGMQLPAGRVSALAVGAARAVASFERSRYEFHRGIAVAVGGTVYHRWQDGGGSSAGGTSGSGHSGRSRSGERGGPAERSGPGGDWTAWEAMRTLPEPVADLAFAAHSSPGHWDVFALDSAGVVHHRACDGPADWSAIPGPGGRSVSAIAACYGVTPELVAVAGGDVWRTRQFQSGQWQEWEAVMRPNASAVDVALSPLDWDGELFVLDRTGQVHYESLSADPGVAETVEMPRLPVVGGPVRAIAASPMLTQGRERRQVLCALAANGTLHYTSSGAVSDATLAGVSSAGGVGRADATIPLGVAWANWQPMPPPG
jgi:hypothetical protein